MRYPIAAVCLLAVLAGPASAQSQIGPSVSDAKTYCSADSGTTWLPCNPGSGGGGGGGSNAAAGTIGSTTPTYGDFMAGQNTSGNLTAVLIASDGGVQTHVTNFPALQPVSAASLPLPTGAATSANQAIPQAPGTSASTAEPVQGVAGGVPIPTTQPRATTTHSNGTITTANTFQSVLASSTTRLGCLVVNTSTSAMTVDVGASPAAATAIPLAAGGTFDCSHPSGATITDQINLTSATAGATFVVWAQ